MPTDEIRLPGITLVLEEYEASAQMRRHVLGPAAREELRLVLEVLRAAEAWRDSDTLSISEMTERADAIVAALSALRSVR